MYMEVPFRKPDGWITGQALTWSLHGAKRRRRPRNTWRRDIDRERERMGVTWGELCKKAEIRSAFKVLIGILYFSGTSRSTL